MWLFASPIIEEYYNYIISHYPALLPHADELYNIYKVITLPDKKPTGEYFVQNLEMENNLIIPITWNIEKLLRFIPNTEDI